MTSKKLKPFHGADKLLNHIHKSFNNELKKLMKVYFVSLDKMLLDRVKDPEPDTDSVHLHKLYLESLSSIRIHKLNVLSSFLSSIRQTFILFENKSFVFFEDKITKLFEDNNSTSHAISKNDVDERLVQNILIHKTETNYQEQLLAFEQRFSFLIAEELEFYQIPISPYVLVSSFAKSIRLLHLDLEIKLILYKLFDDCVISKIGDLYQKINKYLNSNGVVTGIENKIITKQINIDPALKKKQHPVSKGKTDQDSASSEKPILDALENIQKQVVNDSSISKSPAALHKALLQQLTTMPDYQLQQVDKDTINLITMMFQLIAGERNIPSEIQPILATLQIPYFEAAIMDKKMLSKKIHPARQLLTCISNSCIGWSSDTDIENKFITHLNETTTNILKSKHLNENFFASQLKEYQDFIGRQKNLFGKEQEKVKTKLQGRDKIVTAMKTVEALLAHKMENIEFPDLLKGILQGSWKNLLVLLLVRHSNTSDKYLLKVNFIDELIAVLNSKQYDVIIKMNIEKLCVDYRHGLELVAYSGDELDNKIKIFNRCLVNLRNLNKDQVDKKIISQQDLLNKIKTKKHDKVLDKSINTPKESQKKSQPTTKPNLKGLNKKDKSTLKYIKLGTWVNFIRKNRDPVKAQLSWINPQSGRYIFVNDRGLKVTDRMPQDLADELNNKDIIIIIDD